MGPKGNVRPTSSLTVKIETKKVQADQDDDAATAPYLPADDPADDGGNASDAYSHDNTDDQGLGPHSTPAVPAPAPAIKKDSAEVDDDAVAAPYLPADDPADDGGNANDAYSHDNTDDQGLGPHSTPAVPAPAVLAAATLAADGPAGQVR